MFAPDKKTAYLVGELSSTVSVLDYDLTTGAFHLRQTVSTIPDDWTEHNGAAAIRISNDGRFVYVSNRGHNLLVAKKIFLFPRASVFILNKRNEEFALSRSLLRKLY